MEPGIPLHVHERELVTRHTSNLRGVNSYEGLKDGIMDMIKREYLKDLEFLTNNKEDLKDHIQTGHRPPIRRDLKGPNHESTETGYEGTQTEEDHGHTLNAEYRLTDGLWLFNDKVVVPK